MDSGFGGLFAGRGVEQLLGERVEPLARAARADALQGDARAFDEEKELVRELLRLGVAGSAHPLEEALALPALVRLDHAARRVARLGELDRGVGKRAAAAAALDGELGSALEHVAKLRVGIARMRALRLIPESFAFFGELREIRRHQLVLRREM